MAIDSVKTTLGAILKQSSIQLESAPDKITSNVVE